MSQPAYAHPESRGEGPEILTWDDLDVVRGLLGENAPGWTAELNQVCPEDATIVVMPEGANDLIGPCFVLHRTNGLVRLDQFRWDEYRKLGGFRSLADALTALRMQLSPRVSRCGPGSSLVH